MLRQTHTYAILPVSRAVFDEIKQKLSDAGYQHAFHDDVIDMQGIGVQSDGDARVLYVSCPQCGGSGAVSDGEEGEDNCDLCAAKGYALLTAVMEWEVDL